MYNQNQCVICGYSITDPVCRGCYIKQTKLLLKDLKVNSFSKDFIINKVKNYFPFENLNDTECILCGKENVTFCRYCYSNSITRMLRELNFSDDLIENFEYNQMPEDVSLKDEII